MVNFLDIAIEGDYIYATAEVIDYNSERRRVKLHIKDEECFIEGSDDFVKGTIIRACWCLQDRLISKKKLNKNETVAWY